MQFCEPAVLGLATLSLKGFSPKKGLDLQSNANREERVNLLKNKPGCLLVSTALTAAMLCSAAAPVAYADDRSKCQHNIEKIEAKLDDAIRKHGPHSRQAEDRRRDLNNEREKCWGAYHAWYDGHEHRWHNERDWDHDDRH